MRKTITGIFPALTTPFEDGKLSVERLISNVEKFNKVNFAGYLVLGSTGESVHLTDSERISAIEAVREHAAENRIIIAGTGMQSTAMTIELTNKAADAGADYALAVTPSYYKGGMTAKALEHYYRDLAKNSRIPVLMYNVPKFTGLSLPLDTIFTLAEHPNIAGLKDSSADLTYHSRIIHECPSDFSVLQGGGTVLFPSLVLGSTGGILALSNMASKETVAIYEYFRDGNLEKAREIQMRLVKVNQVIVGSLGVPGIKCALDTCGFFGGDPRSPLQPADQGAKDTVKKVLAEAGII